MSRYLGFVDSAERLYESVVTSPDDWIESRFAEWAEEIALDGAGLDREAQRQIRKIIRSASKLKVFWSENDKGRPEDHGDWRSRVDIALGARAWRPVLDLAMHGLDVEPSAELFEVVKDRFAVVTSQRWMEGIAYVEWLAGR